MATYSFDDVAEPTPAAPKTFSFEDVTTDKANNVSPRPGIVKSFWDTISEKSPLELWKTQSLPAHLGQGMARINTVNERVNDKYNALPNKPDNLQDRLHLRHQIRNEVEKELDRSMGQATEPVPAASLSDVYHAFQQNPGKFAGEIFKGVETDPELLFGGEMGLARGAVSAVNKAATVAKAGAAVSSIARVGARVAGTAAEGAVITGGISAADQFAKGHASAEAVGKDALNGGILMSLLGLKRLGRDIEFGKGAANAKLTPESMDQILGENPKATVKDVEKVYGEFKSKMPEIPTKPWDTAYKLLNGRLKGKEKLAAQKDPEVWKVLDTIQKERQARARTFGGENPKTMDERIDQLKVRADKLKEIQKDQAWDARSAFDNEAPSVEESFKRMEDFQRQRSVDEKISDMLREETEGFELPSQSGGPRAARMQEGKADIKLLSRLGLTLGGALAGAYFAGDNEKPEGVIAGGLAALAAMRAGRIVNAFRTNWKSAATTTATVGAGTMIGMHYDKDHPVEGALLGAFLFGGGRTLLPEARELSTDEFFKIRNGTVAAADRQSDVLQMALEQAVPDTARRIDLAQKMETNDHIAGLTADESRAVNRFRDMTKTYHEMAKDVDMQMGFIHNYVSHITEKVGLPVTHVQKLMDAIVGDSGAISGTGTSTRSPFMKARKYATFADLEHALNNQLKGMGIRIKTKDFAEIANLYMRSMHRAIENKRLIENLKVSKESNGFGILMDAKKAPPGYKAGFSNHPQMLGMAAHPDYVPSLKFVFDTMDPHLVTRGMLAMNAVTKRLNVVASLFHAHSLVDAFLASTGWKALREGVSYLMPKGVSAMIKGRHIAAAIHAYRNGGAGDAVDFGLRNGLRINMPHDDVNTQVLEQVGVLADSLWERTTGLKSHNVAEKGLMVPEKLQRKYFDRVTWDVLHSGMKLSNFLSEYERALLKNPKADPNQIAANVASYVNDTYGGLDWFRAATESTTQAGRNLAMAMFSPQGRRIMQAWMFAPDWTISTFRAMWKAIPGNANNKATAWLHQKYFLRSAVIYLTAMNALNRHMSGHNLWDEEQKNPLRLDRGDGTEQQFSKHATEFFDWILNPRQMVLNKLGFVPKVSLEILNNVEYLRADGRAPPIKGSKIGHLAKQASPIALQQGFTGYKGSEPSLSRAAWGFFGNPIYKQTNEDKEKAKLQNRIDNAIDDKAVRKRIEKALKGP